MSYNNDYTILQSAKILALYGQSASAPVVGDTINKAEDTDELGQSAPGQDDEQRNRLQKAEETAFTDLIEKGQISSALTYGYGNSEPMKFNKSGKQLKEQLPATVALLKGAIATYEVQMNAISTQLGIAPTEAYKSYDIPNITYSRYPWSMCDRVYDSTTQSYAEETDSNKLCNAYNSLASACVNAMEDVLAAEAVIANVEDSKTYTLTINQLIALNLK